MTKRKVGTHVYLQEDFDTAMTRVTEALKKEGFGILTEIDIPATFKAKLGIDFRPYKILGACNPSLAHRALLAAPEVGMLLPCNVTVAQQDDSGVLISIIDPMTMLGVLDGSSVEDVADEAAGRLERVVRELAG